jgi:hypothetical protein
VNLLHYQRVVVSELFLSKYPPYVVEPGSFFINAYNLGKERDLINRLIHRSWGEGVVTIALDLSLHIFHCSYLTSACALGRKNSWHR